MSGCTCDLYGVASCPRCCTQRQGVEPIIATGAAAEVLEAVLDSLPASGADDEE